MAHLCDFYDNSTVSTVFTVYIIYYYVLDVFFFFSLLYFVLTLCPFQVYYCRLLDGSLCLLSFVFVISMNVSSLLNLEMNIVNIMMVIFSLFLLFCIRQMIVVTLLLCFGILWPFILFAYS